ncbi:MAG: glycosyltransferase family 2 protein [bacterium]|nr:glycosyltransferase family 2 protein [bacterium]
MHIEIKDRLYLRIGKASDVQNPRERVFYRILEMLPGVLAWGTLLGAVLASWFWPMGAAIFIILFDVYWLLKTIFFSLHLVSAYRRMKENLATDWMQKLHVLRLPSSRLPSLGAWRDVYHLVILPFYDEPAELIRSSLEALRTSRYPLERLIVVLASENRAGELGKNIAVLMEQEFGKSFFKFLITVHPANIAGEIAGKGSNEAWAGREAQKLIDALRIPHEHVLVSVFDSDTRAHPGYFGCLTWNFLTAQNPLRSSYQPVPVFTNNIWEAPFFSRVVASSSTFWHMMKQENEERLTTFSSHAMSFAAIVKMDFWQTNIVSEDSRVFWQALLAFDGDYRVVPLHYPVAMDACLAHTLWQTARNQYKQQRRWGWGIENVPYTLFGFWKNPAIALRKKIRYAFMQIEGFWSWSTNAILLFVLGWLPLALGGEVFNRTVLSYNLPLIARTLMSLALVGMFVSTAISLLLLPRRPERYGKKKTAAMVLQWLFLPISVMVLGAFPGLEAQTRLMLGRYMGFWVTEKARKA